MKKSITRTNTNQSRLSLGSKLTLSAFAVIAVVVTGIFINSFKVHAAQAPINLGTTAPFAILAGTPNITDSPTSVINGNVGLSPATGAGIGLTCLQVTGTIYSVDAGGPLPCRITDPSLLTIAKNDLITAYDDTAGRTPETVVPTELGGTTKTAGVYSAGTFGITAGAGALVLDGQGDPSSVFIFDAQSSSTSLTVGPGSTVSLVNGAQACNVFWRVDSASINTTATFKGTIFALTSISVANGATIEGRLLARNGNVTLINDTITVPTCTTPTASGGGSAGGSSSVPGLPNTGSSVLDNNYFWIATVIAVIAVTTVVSLIVIQKKRPNRS
jgi:hypothetical protein